MKLLLVAHFIDEDGSCVSYERMYEQSKNAARFVDAILNLDEDGNSLPASQLPTGEVCRERHSGRYAES